MKSRLPFLHSIVLLIHPEKVRASSIVFRRTFGLGGMALLLFVTQVITGILLRFVYEPTPQGAYDSILFIKEEVIFGNLVRNIHHWSGMLIVVLVFLHLLRVFYTQAYYPPRRFNWVTGLILLMLVILLNFTGYLLPWDQLSYWAVTVSTNMLEYVPVIGGWLQQAIRGGEEVSGPTLLIFYNLHTGVLALTLLILLVFHFWKV
ncbi:MAG: cytochrome b N-terminal domain-containing protein, partial [Bacteroidales bacterium]|nr:cytochrome b N-terminal domain-containing protein [Bacteroidales bacterium]